ALSLDPALTPALYNRASVLAGRGDLAGALADLDELLKRDPDDGTAYLSRGRIHEQMNNHAQAIADNEAALERSPDDPPTLNTPPWVRETVPEESLRDGQKALARARKAIESGEASTRLDTLAAALAAAGEFAEAAKTQQRAFEAALPDEKDD